MRKIVLAIILVGMLLLSGCEMIAGKAGSTGQCGNPPLSLIQPREKGDPQQICKDRCKYQCEAIMGINTCTCDKSTVVKQTAPCGTYTQYLTSTETGAKKEECMRLSKNFCKGVPPTGMGCERGTYTVNGNACEFYCYKIENWCQISCKGNAAQEQPPGREYGRANEPATTMAPQVTAQARPPAQGISAQYQRGIQPGEMTTTRRPRPLTSQW